MFENEETKVNELQFNTKYVSGQALEVITDFKANSYIIKGSTGIGGTTALLNYTKSHCLIISPYVSMIEDKSKGTYKSDKQFFIYSDSQDNWNDVNDYLTISNNVIINTTPNQLLILRNDNRPLYNQLTKIPLFLDEYHVYTVDSNYRIEGGQFLALVENEWHHNFKLSTATPNYLNLDVPTDKNVIDYKLIRANQPTKRLQLSNNTKDVKDFIIKEHLKGRLVVCFTNNINYHKSFKDVLR